MAHAYAQVKAAEQAALNVHSKLNMQAAPIRQYLVGRGRGPHWKGGISWRKTGEGGPVLQTRHQALSISRMRVPLPLLLAGGQRGADTHAGPPSSVQGAAREPRRVPRLLPALTQPPGRQAPPSGRSAPSGPRAMSNRPALAF